MELLAQSSDQQTLYLIVGAFAITQLGTIFAVLVWIGKAIWWAAEKNTEIKKMKKDINNAHRLRRGEPPLCDGDDKKEE